MSGTKPIVTNFSLSVRSALTERSMSQASLADNLDISSAYISKVLSGHRSPSAKWVDLVADSLQVSPERRVEMHRAAAKDLGFKLDLSFPDSKP